MKYDEKVMWSALGFVVFCVLFFWTYIAFRLYTEERMCKEKDGVYIGSHFNSKCFRKDAIIPLN